jgi:predicted CoA-binding protein
MGKIVAVIGATDHKEKFANRAIKLLKKKGHSVVPVNPLYEEVDGLHCFKSLNECGEAIDTITVYLNPEKTSSYIEDIITVNPKRVILNPGTENPLLEKRLEDAGISVIRDCTLIMLDNDKF